MGFSAAVRPSRISGWIWSAVLLLVALLLIRSPIFGEDGPPGEGGEEPAPEAKDTGPDSAPKSAEEPKVVEAPAGAVPVSDFAKSGAKAAATVGDVAAEVAEGVLTVSRGKASVSFEYKTMSWGGDAAVLKKAESSAEGKSSCTDRGDGCVEVVTADARGFEHDFVIAEPGGSGDLVLTGAITTSLKLDETFLREEGAKSFDYAGDLVFLDAADERVLRVSRTWVKDAAGQAEVCTVRYTETSSGLDFEVRVPETWLKSAKYPVTVDPVIGSPTVYPEGGNLDDWPADVAFGSNRYFMVFLVKISPTIHDIYGRIFTVQGVGGSDFLIMGGYQLACEPRVAYCSGSSGIFAVAMGISNGSGLENVGSRRYNTVGSSLGSPVWIGNSATTTQITELDVCSNGTNRFLYTWGGATSSGIHKLYGELRSDTGSLVTDDKLLEDASGNIDLGLPHAVYSPTGTKWIVAYDLVDAGISGSPHTLRTTCWNSSLGSKLWGPVTVAGAGGESHERSALALNTTDSEILAVWTKLAGAPATREVRGRRLDLSGGLLGSEFAVETGGDQSLLPVVGYRPSSNRYVVLYNYTADAATTGGIYGQVVLNDGTLWQSQFVVQDDGSYYETGAVLAAGILNVYEFLSAWKGKPNLGSDSETWVAMLDISPPAVPTGLAATPADQAVGLTWNAVTGTPDLAGYNVYYRLTSGGGWTKANGAVVTTTSFSVTGLVNGTSYTFAVASLDTQVNESAKSSTVVAIPVDGTPPAAPTGLGATVTSHTVHLTWNPNSEPDLAGYDVYRAFEEFGLYAKINGALVTGTAYSDGGRTNGTPYWYGVVARDTSGNSSPGSATVMAIPAYSVPGALTHDGNGYGTISMHWSAVTEPDLAGYLVYRSATSSGPYSAVTPSPITATSFTDTGLSAGTYYYVVTAKSTGTDESAYSNEISGTALATPIPTLDSTNTRKTNDPTPLITGSSEPGFLINLYEGLTLIGSGVAGPSGSFSFSITTSLGEGDHVIQATATVPGAGGPTSGLSSGVVVTVDTTPPSPPANVVTSAGNGWAEVRWDPNSETDLLGYNVYRRTGGGAWTKLNDKPLVNARYLDRPLPNGTTYEYKVTAVDDTKDED